ncbi:MULTISPECIES: hypothetical protein [Sphingobacterium]|uniref:Uncharacterized protein n=1 Tax=Sphingobacterium siyangense TaxID=459529 RepID=A0A420FB42_9SPHI|nr:MULTISPECIES: hypothetical protein [Sphingobacterium]MBB1644830.1 hypothetical protein [Sphingobacterium sp. UME9]RKF30172.1 hypothetical protein BCY89_20450 [Sphingobacterium siyangense]
MELINYFSDPNEAVLTTSFVLNKTDQISRVYHHLEDGMWEFISERAVKESDYKVISMEEILYIDEGLLSLSDMEPGFFAYRKEPNGTFEIKIIEE